MIFGSQAVKHWFPDFPREPSDLDVMSQQDVMTKEEQHYWVPTFGELIKRNKDKKYLDPEFCLVNKMSHAGWDIHWEKTIHDIVFLKQKGVSSDRELYFKLVKDWTKVHGKRWASLKGKDSKTFFEDAVARKYVHDSIHEAVAVYDAPLYEALIYEGVSCSEEGFERLSHEDKILMVKEETWVTALERFLIPRDFAFSKVGAYQLSLKKLATTMSSGWFKWFILDNIEELRACRDFSYIDKFKQAESEGKIQLNENT